MTTLRCALPLQLPQPKHAPRLLLPERYNSASAGASSVRRLIHLCPFPSRCMHSAASRAVPPPPPSKAIPQRSFATSEPSVCSRPSSCCGDCKLGSSAFAAAAPAPVSAGCADGSYECWKCRHDVRNAMFCKACGCVQSLACCLQKQTNSFAVFDMEPTFDVDADALDVAFKNLQRRVHPDSFYSKSRMEAELALQVSSTTRNLKNPIRRVQSCT